MLVCAFLSALARETAGAARTRSSLLPSWGSPAPSLEGRPAPSLRKGGRCWQNSREMRGEIARLCRRTMLLKNGIRKRDEYERSTFNAWSRPGAQLRVRRRDPYAEDFRFGYGVATMVLKSRTPGGMGPGVRRDDALRQPFASTPNVLRRRSSTYSLSSCFLPPMVFSLANTASTLRSSRCFSDGSNSGSFLVVSEAGSKVAPP
jgi:hypothetical protein